MDYHRLAAVTFAFFLSAPASMAAVETPAGFDIASIESRLFQHDNSNRLCLEQRLDRLEQFVFGNNFSGDADQRVARIRNVVASLAHELSLEMHVSCSKQVASVPLLEPAPGSAKPFNVDWAMPQQQGVAGQVDQLEKLVFAANFNDDSLVTRIHRLENQVYPRILISTTEELTTRVDRLADRVEELNQSHSLPIGNPVAFDESTYTREVAANDVQSQSLTEVATNDDPTSIFGSAGTDDTDDRARNFNSALDRHGNDPNQNSETAINLISRNSNTDRNFHPQRNTIFDQTDQNRSSGLYRSRQLADAGTADATVMHRQHKFRRALLGALKNIAIGTAFVIESL